MPFDALAKLPPGIDLLQRLDVVPLSQQRVTAHKESVTAEFCQRSELHREAYRNGLARWVASEYSATQALKRFHPPKQVTNLVRYIAEYEPRTVFRVEWFYDDPILYVSGDGLHPLAIWDGRTVVALAKEARPTPLWRRMVNRLR